MKYNNDNWNWNASSPFETINSFIKQIFQNDFMNLIKMCTSKWTCSK